MFRVGWKLGKGPGDGTGWGPWCADHLSITAQARMMGQADPVGLFWVEVKPWQVWSTVTPNLIEQCDVEDPPNSPEAAVRSACLWNLGMDGGAWFYGGVATIGVEAPTGERWTCTATLVNSRERITLTPMIPLPAAPTETPCPV